MIRASGLAACLAALSLSGCVPIPTTYDAVSAPEGKAVDCPGVRHPTGGPLNILILDRGPASVVIDARSLVGPFINDWPRHFYIYIRTDSRRLMKPDWNGFKMVDLGTGKPIPLPDPSIEVTQAPGEDHFDSKGFEPGDVLGLTRQEAPDGVRVVYTMEYDFPERLPDHFSFTFPALQVDMQLYAAVTLQYTRTHMVVTSYYGGCY